MTSKTLNSNDRLILKAELDLRVGMYVIANSNAIRIDRNDIYADFGHSLWSDNLGEPMLEDREYLIPIVEQYNPSFDFHRNAPRVIELGTGKVITHSHSGAEQLIKRSPLEQISLDKIKDNITNECWYWVNKSF